MPEVAALSTVLGVNIRTLFPEGMSLAYRPFFNTTFTPLDLAKPEAESIPTATIMWSCIEPPINGKFKKANHFVAVLPAAATKGTKRNHPANSFHPPVKRTSFKGMLLHPNKQSPSQTSSRKLTDYYSQSVKTSAAETTAIPSFQCLPSPLNPVITHPGASDLRPSSISTSLTKHRQSSFDVQWQKEFQWVTTKIADTADNEVLGMFCGLCRKHSCRPHRGPQSHVGKATWVDVPCTSLRLESLVRHQQSDTHIMAVEKERKLALASSFGRTVVGLFEPVISGERRAMIARFKLVYWLCKEHIAHTTKFSSLVGLAKSLGVEYIDEVCKGANASYTSERFLCEVVQILAAVTHNSTFASMKKSPFFSILVDETTDVAVHRDLIIYAKFLSKQREVTTSFVGLLQLSDGRADTIFDAMIQRLVEKEELDIQVSCVAGKVRSSLCNC